MKPIKLFCGSANVDLAREVAIYFKAEACVAVEHFKDGEVNVKINANWDLYNEHVYVLQSTCPPVNNHLMELVLLTSTLKRSGAKKVTAVIPYFGYARQDRRIHKKDSIASADVAKILETMGVDHLITIDLHCLQLEGFFSPKVPIDNIEAACLGVDYFAAKISTEMKIGLKEKSEERPRWTIVSPDTGGIHRAKTFLTLLEMKTGLKDQIRFAIIIKERLWPNEVASMQLVGSVQSHNCIIVDDIIDTGGTLVKAATLISDEGAETVSCFATHGLFSDSCLQKIEASGLKEVVVTNSVPLKKFGETDKRKMGKINVLGISGLIIKEIERLEKANYNV